MTAEIIKLPYNVTRKLHSRKPRRSKNGTPEERAANAAQVVKDCEGGGAGVIAFRRRAETAATVAPTAENESVTNAVNNGAQALGRRCLYSNTFFRLPFVTLPENVPADWGEFWKQTDMWNEAASAASYKEGKEYGRLAVAAIRKDDSCDRQLEIVVDRMIEQAFRRRGPNGKLCRGLSSSEKGFLNALCNAAVAHQSV
jgi:hypothetical protein